MSPRHNLTCATLALTATLAGLSLLADVAAAQPPGQSLEADVDSLRLGFGARIGGYGFREPQNGSTSWLDCRMDGGGLFGTLDLGEHTFTELAMDFYQAHADVVDHGMDRMSMHAQAAIGLRMFPDFYVSPYLQLGGGAEWTRVSMLESDQEDISWQPTGFFGVGGEINVTANLKFGANIRMFIMALPEHDDGHATAAQALGEDGQHAHVDDPDFYPGAAQQEGSEGINMRFEAAGQAQFFMRYAL